MSNELAAFRDEIKKLISDLQSKIENIGNAKEQVRGDPEDITYFRSVVDDFLDGTPLPFTNYGDVQALDKAIKADKDFAVSLVRNIYFFILVPLTITKNTTQLFYVTISYFCSARF